MDGFDALYKAQDYEDKQIKWRLKDWWDEQLIYTPKQPTTQKGQNEMKMTDMFPSKFLTGNGLLSIAQSGQILVELVTVAKEKMRAGAGMPEEVEAVVYFKIIDPKTDQPRQVVGLEFHNGRGYGRVLNKTLAEQIFSATKTTDTDEWKGKRVVFYAADTKAGGEVTKTVCARAPKIQTKPAEQPAQEQAAQPTLDEAQPEPAQ